MSFYQPPPNQPAYSAQNLQFYPSSYGAPVSGHSTPAQAGYGSGGPYGGGGGGAAGAAGAGYGYANPIGSMGFMASPGFGQQGVSGRMGEQGGLRTGWLAAFGTEGYDGEPALLEELGVNFGHIKGKVCFRAEGRRTGEWRWSCRVDGCGVYEADPHLSSQTLTVLNPIAHIDQHIMDDSDLFGPIIFCLLFGTFLLLSGKVHFGYIYGVAAIGSVSLHLIFSLMSNPQLDSASAPPMASPGYNPAGGGMHGHGHGHDAPDGGASALTFFRSCSVLGYCLLPLVLTSLVGVALPMDTLLGYLLTSAAVAWCTYSSSGMFCAVGRMRSMRPLVAYPLMLFYVGFGIMGIFSSRGSGVLTAGSGKSSGR
jgi:hypothetical protein